MHPRIPSLLLACSAALAPAFAQGTSQGGSVGNQIAAPPIALPKDPTNTGEYPCYYWGYYIWNDGGPAGAVQGHIYWPSDCVTGTQPAGVHPAVLLMHGDGHHYDEYEYLCRHLALNGFIVATIAAGTEVTNVERAWAAHNFVGFMTDHWQYRNHVANNWAIVGHSRGGEAAFTTARKFDEWGTGYDVNAVIALSPTDSDANGGTEGLESLVRSSSESLLVMYGSRDNDVYGNCLSGTLGNCGFNPTSAQATGFALYDRAGAETSTDDLPFYDDVVTKTMLFVDGADHGAWRDSTCGWQAPPGHITCDDQNDVAKAYLNSFLRWRLRGQDIYREFFTRRLNPMQIQLNGTLIRSQFGEGLGRRVIDNFEAGGSAVSTVGTVTQDQLVTAEAPAYTTFNFSVPHDTQVLALRWDRPNPFVIAPWMRWAIPDVVTPNLGKRLRDVREFACLSLRVGQVYESNYNVPGESQDFYVRLRDSGGNWSNKVAVSGYADLAYPDDGFVIRPGQAGFTAKSSMRTVRIPRTDFHGVDYENITDVELNFGVSTRLEGEVVIDSLEFTR